MNVYLRPPGGLSRAMFRVAKALSAYAPASVRVVPTETDADVIVLHVIGMTGLRELIAEILAAGQRYVIMQYCLRSTEIPQPQAWIDIWTKAVLVWSYYDLQAFCAEGGLALTDYGIFPYESPLGVDASVFQARWPAPGGRAITCLTSGYVAESESVGEVIGAAARVQGRVFHLGPDLKLGALTSRNGLTDEELAAVYGQCQFVSGLRRCEGFELPAAEGLLCGARPILYDQPHYRRWYRDFAEYVPETDPATVTDAVEMLFVKGPRPVTAEEVERARQVFDWERIASGFWGSVLANHEVAV